jgi:hypothetical protein
VFLVPRLSTVCRAENYITETNSGAVIRIGEGNGGEDECSRRRFRDPAISTVRCAEDYALTGIQRSANYDTMVRVREQHTIKVSRRSACLRRPTASAICCSDYCPILTNRGACIYICERDSKKESGGL